MAPRTDNPIPLRPAAGGSTAGNRTFASPDRDVYKRQTDTIFENRFSCAEGFSALGGSVNVSGRTLYVHGVPALRAARLCAPDLRGGAALVIAALQAEGESFLTETGHIMRGYEDLPALFGALGAKIVPVRDWDENL